MMPAPPVPPHLFFYLRAFYSLSPDRINNDGNVGGIPMPSKAAFCSVYGISNSVAFCEIIESMDDAFRSKASEMKDKRK